MHRRFLNRLLGLPVARQNLFFNYFACTLAAEIRAAKAEGRYFEGVSDLGGSHVSKVEPQVFLMHLPAPWPALLCINLQEWGRFVAMHLPQRHQALACGNIGTGIFHMLWATASTTNRA